MTSSTQRDALLNRAVVIHTAMGRHLEELEDKFTDVGCSRTERGLSEPIENLRNLGPTAPLGSVKSV